MKEVKKLTVLEFKKEQLVNLNEEEIFKVKGGADTTWNCVKAIYKGVTKVTNYYWAIDLLKGDDSTIEKPFKVTDNYLGADITCASSPELIVYG